MCVWNPASGLLQIGHKSEKLQWRHNLRTWRTSSYFFGVVLFLLSSLVNVPSFVSISLLVLELWQFSFISDWPEILKSEIPPSEFCPISGDWGELEIPNLARMSLIKCYCKMPGLQFLSFLLILFTPLNFEISTSL